MSTANPLLRFQGVSCQRAGKTVLEDLDLDCTEGEILGLLGPNGAGKTSTIGLALGLLRPNAGKIGIAGHTPGSMPARRMVGAMLQSGKPAQAMTAREWLLLAAAGQPASETLADIIELAGIGELLNRKCETLSGGQLQRVRLAAALAGQPRLLFLDEPTAGMDVDSRHRLWRGLRQLREKGCGILMTTHDLDEAEQLSDRIALLHEGRIIACDTTARICDRVPGRAVRCRTRLPEKELASWPEVNAIRVSGAGITLMVKQAEAVVARLLARDPQLSGLEVRGAGLEEAFLHLTDERREVAA